MRVVFMGTPEFAVPSLRALASAHDVVAVYTQPDRPRGRGRQPRPSPVKSVAEESGIAVEQPATLRDAEVIARLSGYAPDVICVAAYGLILPSEVLAVPPLGCLNVHASLLPKYRGAAPVHRAILRGDEETGVSIMRVEEGLDTGPYAAVRTVRVGDKNVPTLTAELAEMGAEALLDTLEKLEAGTVVWTPQDESEATYAPKVSAHDVALEPSLPVQEALRRIRASTPSARTRVCLGDREVEVLDAHPSPTFLAAGEVQVVPEGLLLGFADGTLGVSQCKPAGRPAMEGCAFARGARLDCDVPWSGAL